MPSTKKKITGKNRGSASRARKPAESRPARRSSAAAPAKKASGNKAPARTRPRAATRPRERARKQATAPAPQPAAEKAQESRPRPQDKARARAPGRVQARPAPDRAAQRKRGWRDIEAMSERARLKKLLSDIWHEDIELEEDIFGETDHLAGYYTDSEDEDIPVEPDEDVDFEDFEEEDD